MAKLQRKHQNVSQLRFYHFLAFVIKRGKVGVYLKELQHDFRSVLYPFTAKKLVESKKNSIKDFVGVAGVFGVSHMLIFTQTTSGNYLRIMKLPKGPTLTFKIEEYALARDVVKFTQKAKKDTKIFSTIL